MSSAAKVAFTRKLKEDYCCRDWRAFKAGLKAFCGGKKKGSGGTPPVHASSRRNQQGQGRREPSVRSSLNFGIVGGGGGEPDPSPSMPRSMTV